jgi:hypothetical protein
VSEKPPSQDLFKEHDNETSGKGQATMATSRLKKLGLPNGQMGLADPLLGPPADRFGPQPPNGYHESCLGCFSQSCSEKVFKNIFQRIFMLRNIFKVFVKIEKRLEKNPSMQERF